MSDESHPSHHHLHVENKRKIPRRYFFIGGSIVLVVILAVYFYFRSRESTDDAFVEGHIMEVGPQIGGLVQHVLVSDNQVVKAGDLLVEIDPRDNQAVYDSAKANLDSAQAKLVQAQAQLASSQAALAQAEADVEQTRATAVNAAQELTRNQELRQRGVVDQQDLDRAQASSLASNAGVDSRLKKVQGSTSDVQVNAAAVKSAQAQVELANALLDTATLRLSYTKIYAPESGRITRKNVEIGNYVQTGAALMAVVPDDVWIVANFKETQLDLMRPGQPVDIRVDAYPSIHYRGQVNSIQKGTGSRFSLLPSENATGNYVKVVQRVPVKIDFVDFPKDSPLLAPGMSVVPTVHVR